MRRNLLTFATISVGVLLGLWVAGTQRTVHGQAKPGSGKPVYAAWK
jgi:uncharacterized protein HemY